jgi:hypothetical protein
MRMQLIRAATSVVLGAALVAVAAPRARADGELTVRGVYYKERATRVQQPMLDGAFDVSDSGVVSGHVLVDAITSASGASGAAGEAFSETRYEAGAGYTHQLSHLRLGGTARYSTEPDYRSLFGGARVELELFEKNLVLGVGGDLGRDHVTNAGAQDPLAMNEIEGDLTTMLGSFSVSQLVSQDAVVAVTYDVARLDGFQQNPYRSVVSDMGLIPEVHPEKRTRQAIAGTGRYFLGETRTVIVGTYRYYFDDWGVHAHTPELRVVQEAGDGVEFGARYRFHHQDAADFFSLRYAGTEMYRTDDVKLSAFESHTFEGKLGAMGEVFGLSGRWAGSRMEVLLQYVAQDNRFGNAIVAQAAFTVPFTY